MKQLHQHPDGVIVIRTDNGIYQDTPENFALDSGVELPPLPPGVDERIYEPDVRHALMDRVSVLDGGPMPWPMGDEIIAQAQEILARQRVRNPPPPEPEQPALSAPEQPALSAPPGQLALSAPEQ